MALGNPAAAMAAKGLFASAKKVLSNKYVKTALIVIVLALIFRKTIKSAIRNYRQKKFNKDEAKDVNQIAQQYRAASNPSGISWMIDIDGSDEEAIDRLAYQTKGSLEEISDAYRLKFDEALTDRLRKELDSKELQSWRNIVT